MQVVGEDDAGEEIDDEEDEEYLQQAEKFEHAYNFRYEGAGDGKQHCVLQQTPSSGLTKC